MKRILDKILAFRNFLLEVMAEVQKSSWPARNELLESTSMLIVAVVLFSAFVGLSDVVLRKIVNLLISRGG